MDKVFNLSPVVNSHAPLCHWHEITGQPGLLHCINQTSGNPVLVMVTPDKILVIAMEILLSFVSPIESLVSVYSVLAFTVLLIEKY